MKNYIKILRPKLLECLTHRVALPILLLTRGKKHFAYTMDDLSKLPEGTLGKDLYQTLTKNGFTLLRHYERHDCKHIILNYPMNECGEAAMQFHLLGSKHRSIPVLITVGVCLFIMPDYWSHFKTAYQRGKHSGALNHLDYNALIPQFTSEIRKNNHITINE